MDCQLVSGTYTCISSATAQVCGQLQQVTWRVQLHVPTWGFETALEVCQSCLNLLLHQCGSVPVAWRLCLANEVA